MIGCEHIRVETTQRSPVGICENQKDVGTDCDGMFDCCDCGGHDCGCRYCWSCNACEKCLDKGDDK